MDAHVTHDLFEFEGFCLDRRSGGLFRQNAAGGATLVEVGSRALDVLAVLLAHAGELVTKQAIMQAVWPGMVVDEKNLTVQISALRRVLDSGQAERSCILTEAGRGYRLVAPVTRKERELQLQAEPFVAPAANSRPRRHRMITSVVGAVALLLGGLMVLAWNVGRIGAGENAPPRLSMVVLPFQNLGADGKDDYLADAVTDDLTADLSRIVGAFVIARESAYTYKGKATDVRQIGRELGVRYVLEGSVRRLDTTLRVNVQLISAETGAHLWSDRFDEEIGQLAVGQQQIIARMSDTIGFSVVDIETARSLRERPTNTDAFDLVLRARSLEHLPGTPKRRKEIAAHYERALALDPLSVPAMVGVAYHLIEAAPQGDWGSSESMKRAERLLAQAGTQEPGSPKVLNTALYWLRKVGRCTEVIETAEHAIRIDPNRIRPFTGVYNELAVCKERTGHAEEALALQAKADELNPRSLWKFSRYRHMGFAALLLGRDREAIAFLQKSLALNPGASQPEWTYRMLAAAHARAGQADEARRWLSESVRLWPYQTVRGVYPDELSSTVYAEQMRGYQAALRLAGLRDHADEDADFGVVADGSLHSERAGYTPMSAPGVTTIRTAALVPLLGDARPLVIDTASNSWGRSIPGAVGLKFAGLGGDFADEVQDRLRRKLAELTGGDLRMPIVAVGWNSERFDGRNLALRLAALGYTRVHWYRGGREAWEVAELPETELVMQEW